MAKKYRPRRRWYSRRHRGRSKFKIPILPTVTLAGTAFASWEQSGHDIKGAIDNWVGHYTGFSFTDGSFNAERLWQGLFPFTISCVISKFVGGWPLNANRVFKKLPVRL